ncbi:hypothetical protein ACQ0MK_05805 [Thalassospira lucentensis]|uniref:hypothetical protein n=1 Tax=Thalassospira lucentensis TaxID=168935 RepID=UPI003D2E9EF6
MSLFSRDKTTDKDQGEPQVFFIIFAKVIISQKRDLTEVIAVDCKCHGDNCLLAGVENRSIVLPKRDVMRVFELTGTVVWN